MCTLTIANDAELNYWLIILCTGFLLSFLSAIAYQKSILLFNIILIATYIKFPFLSIKNWLVFIIFLLSGFKTGVEITNLGIIDEIILKLKKTIFKKPKI
jgi:hypothetical protein